jgi:uncharacterized protein (DUF302 family)
MITAKEARELSDLNYKEKMKDEFEQVKKDIEEEIKSHINLGHLGFTIKDNFKHKETLEHIIKWLNEHGYCTELSLNYIHVSWI